MLGHVAPNTLLSKAQRQRLSWQGGVASNAATERAAFTRGAACGHCTYYEGGECCQGEYIGGLKSGYFDGVGTSLSSEEGTEPIEGNELILRCHDEFAHGLLTASTDAESPPRVGFLSLLPLQVFL